MLTKSNNFPNPKSIQESGIIFLDYNGVIFKDGKVDEKIIIELVQLVSLGFAVAINTNNKCDEVIASLVVDDRFLLEYVPEYCRKYFCIYADNRTNCYTYSNFGSMMIDKAFSIGKGFASEYEKNEIVEIIERLLNDNNLQEHAKRIHPDGRFPSFSIINKELQIRIEMKLPTQHDFGEFVLHAINSELQEYEIEVHSGRTGFYITRSALSKSAAIEDALRRFKREQSDCIYIGDKFSDKDDSDLKPIQKYDICGLNVSKDLVYQKNIINIGNGTLGTAFVLDEIINIYTCASNVEKYKSFHDMCCDAIKHSCKRGILIGINGPSASGKSTIADKMRAIFEKQHRHVIVLPFDLFLINREKRHSIMNNPETRRHLSEYVYKGWNVERYCKLLFEISNIQSKKTEDIDIVLANVYDRNTGLSDALVKLEMKSDTIVIVEGVEAINAKSYKYFDIKISISTNPSTILNRLINRELKKPEVLRIHKHELEKRYERLEQFYTKYVNELNIRYNYHIDTSAIEFPVIIKCSETESTNIA